MLNEKLQLELDAIIDPPDGASDEDDDGSETPEAVAAPVED